MGSTTLAGGYNCQIVPIDRITVSLVKEIPFLCECTWQFTNGKWELKYIWRRHCVVHANTPVRQIMVYKAVS